MLLFGFFRLGELLIASASSEEESTQARLSWGDVAIDSSPIPTTIRVFLRVSKCDQMGRGAYVFVGRTNNLLCPVTAVLAYMTKRGTIPGQFFCDRQGKPLCKVRYVTEFSKKSTIRSRCRPIAVCWSQFQDWCSHSCSNGRPRGGNDSDAWTLEQ